MSNSLTSLGAFAFSEFAGVSPNSKGTQANTGAFAEFSSMFEMNMNTTGSATQASSGSVSGAPYRIVGFYGVEFGADSASASASSSTGTGTSSNTAAASTSSSSSEAAAAEGEFGFVFSFLTPSSTDSATSSDAVSGTSGDPMNKLVNMLENMASELDNEITGKNTASASSGDPLTTDLNSMFTMMQQMISGTGSSASASASTGTSTNSNTSSSDAASAAATNALFTQTFGDSGPLPTFLAQIDSSMGLSSTQQQALEKIAIQYQNADNTPATVASINAALQQAGITS